MTKDEREGLRRKLAEGHVGIVEHDKMLALLDAADEADRLREERDEARAALREVLVWIDNWPTPFTDDYEWPEADARARKALGGDDE